jgi:RES domain-containing protein
VIVWRFSQHESLDGRGGLLASARWHTRGAEILYCAPNPATAVLEVLVHAGVRDPAALGRHNFLKIAIPDDVSRQLVDEGQLPSDWSRQVRVTRAWGDRWLAERQTAILIVPSVLVPETQNVLVNPRHADAGRIERLATFPYALDARLVEPH